MALHAAATGFESRGVQDRSPTQILTYVAASLLILSSMFVVTRFPDDISRPLVRWSNSLSGRNSAFDRVCLDFALYPTFSGVLLCGVLFAHWNRAADLARRAEILVGVCISFGAGIVSRYLQHHLLTHARPYYDTGVGFQPIPGAEIPPLNTWNSFPSDHAAVFGGLVVVLFVIRARARYGIALWIVLVESSRTFIGAHFPSDLVGGAALASAIVWSCQCRPVLRAGEWLCSWQYRAPILFYTALFVLLYQVSTLFIEVRNMVGGFDIIKPLAGA